MKKIAATLSASVGFALPLLTYAQVENPTRYNSVDQYLVAVLRLFIGFAIPVLALFIVLAGFQFILARGNPVQLAKAKRNFIYVIIGTFLVLGAYMLGLMVAATLKQLTP